MDNNLIIFDKLVKNYENRFLLILYEYGFAGNLVSRIIRSSHQYYKLEDDPLRFPDNVEGFPYVNVNNPQLNFRKQHLACVHAIPDSNLRYDMFTKEVFTSKQLQEATLRYLKVLHNTTYIINLIAHEFKLEEKYPKVKCIKIYGQDPREQNFYLKATSYTTNGIEPSTNKLTYNLNINNLLSDDYNIFEKEYLSLTWAFDLDCKINSTRSFILLWKDRQKRLNELKN